MTPVTTAEAVSSVRAVAPRYAHTNVCGIQQHVSWQFFSWVNDYEAENPKTHKAGMISKTTLDLKTMTCRAFFKYWGLQVVTTVCQQCEP